MKLWIIHHHHRFGSTSFPVRCAGEPSIRQAERLCEDFEDREDEWAEVHGPYTDEDIPTIAPPKARRAKP